MIKRTISEACRLLALGKPDYYIRCLYVGLALLGLTIIPTVLEWYVPLFKVLYLRMPGLKPLLTFTLALPSIRMIVVGIRPILRLRSHRVGIEQEAPFAVLAVSMLVNAGIPPLAALEALAELDVILPHCAFEVNRIRRDSILNIRHMSEQLVYEAARATGIWGRLLDAIVTLERTGWEPKQYMRDLANLVIQDIRADLARNADYFRTLLSTATVLFGALPMMLAVLFTILASVMIVPLVMVFIILTCFMTFVFTIIVDARVPEITSYVPAYLRIARKWIPLGIAVATALLTFMRYLSNFIQTPMALLSSIALCAFATPAWLEFRTHARAVDQIIDRLPIFLRDIADEVHRGIPPFMAIEYISETHSYGIWMDRLISLLVRRMRLTGSLRSAVEGIEHLLPHPFRVSLGLVILGEEYGASAEAYHILADIMSEYMLSIREFRRGNQSYRWVALGIVFMSIALVVVLFNTVVMKIAIAGEMIQRAPTPLPLLIVTPEQVPMLKDWIYTMLVINSSTLGIVIGKTLDWRIGGGFREMALVSSSFLLLLLVSRLIRIA